MSTSAPATTAAPMCAQPAGTALACIPLAPRNHRHGVRRARGMPALLPASRACCGPARGSAPLAAQWLLTTAFVVVYSALVALAVPFFCTLGAPSALVAGRRRGRARLQAAARSHQPAHPRLDAHHS
jgi:hypothetical protein